MYFRLNKVVFAMPPWVMMMHYLKLILKRFWYCIISTINVRFSTWEIFRLSKLRIPIFSSNPLFSNLNSLQISLRSFYCWFLYGSATLTQHIPIIKIAIKIKQLKTFYSISIQKIDFNPLMHNVPKWSETLSKANSARFLEFVWQFWDILDWRVNDLKT